MEQRQERRMKFTDEQIEQIEGLLASVHLQLASGEKRMNNLASDIGDLANKQDANNAKTDEMFDLFEAAQKGLRFLGSIGNGLKWTAGIVTAIVTAYTLWKGGAK